MDKKNKKSKKQFYRKKQQENNRTQMIGDGVKGFFCTCATGTEKRCIKELYNVLNDYTERLYPNLEELRQQNDEKKALEKAKAEEERKQAANEQEKNQTGEQSSPIDKEIENPTEEVKETAAPETHSKSINELIKDEIDQLKKDQIFYVFDLKLQSLIFIRIADSYKDIIDVQKLGGAIIHDVFEEKKILTRFCLRFMPILFVCKASNFENFKSLVTKEVNNYFGKLDGVKWSMEWKNRGNKSVTETSVLNLVYNLINTTGSGNCVNLSMPDHSVIVEVCMDVILFTILPGFKKYKKYNISNQDQSNAQKQNEKKRELKAEVKNKESNEEAKEEVCEDAKDEVNEAKKDDVKDEESSEGDIDII